LSRQGLIKPQPTSSGEIESLWKLVARDLANAKVADLSLDWQFAISYHAVLQLATIIVRCETYRTTGRSHHLATFAALDAIAGDELGDQVNYFQTCRVKRNITEYGRTGEVTQEEVRNLRQAANEFREWVLDWISANHPDLAPQP